MRLLLKKTVCALLVGVALMLSLHAASAKEAIPLNGGYVTDSAKILSASETRDIQNYLESLEYSTGIQVAVLTLPSLGGKDLEMYALNVAESWGIGRKDKDDGVLLLVSLAERKVRIEVGYGLEDRLTDAKCGLIIRNIITPEFRAGRYGQGIYKAVQNIGGIASGNAEQVSPSVRGDSELNDDWMGLIYGILFVIAWFVLFSSIAGRRNRGFFAWMLFDALLSGSRRSSYRGSYSGHGGSGFSGSAFHGGGGHFGGGGASGGW